MPRKQIAQKVIAQLQTENVASAVHVTATVVTAVSATASAVSVQTAKSAVRKRYLKVSFLSKISQ